MGDKILIVGGYGHVGRRIAAELSSLDIGQVLVAGRDLEKAGALADHLGNNVHPLRVDIHEPATVEAALKDVRLVVNCIDQAEPHLLHLTIDHGLAYLDITARIAFWRAALALDSKARRNGARVLLGAGLLPGITNVMARVVADRVGKVDYLNTALLLSLGDSFGTAALDYMLSSASEPFVVFEDRTERVVHNFTDGQPIVFPPPLGKRNVYRFAFPEQVFYPRTLQARTTATRFTLDPPWVMGFLAVLAKMKLLSYLRKASIRHASARLFEKLQGMYRGRKAYAFVVAARGDQGVAQLSMVGENESEGTAIGATLMARALYEGEIGQPGVWLPEQVITPATFFDELAARNLYVQEYP